MKARKDQTTVREHHVVPRVGGGWAVKPMAGAEPTSIHRTQKEAIERVRTIARAERITLVVHGRDGRVRSRIRYGEDPQATAITTGREFLRKYRRAFERLAKL